MRTEVTKYTFNGRETTAQGCLAMVVLSLGSIVGIVLLRGWGLSLLWAWFVVPTFSGLPSLNILQALGLALVVSLFNGMKLPWAKSEEDSKAKKSEEEEPLPTFGESMGYVLTLGAKPVLSTILLAWIIHWFMPHG
jgi:hypothetical protein